MRVFLFLLALCPQLVFAVNLFLADCGIGTVPGHPTWSRSREVFVYQDGNNNVKDPDNIVVLPWGNGTYPWSKFGVTVEFPDDTNWTFIINNDIPDYNYVGYGLHTDSNGDRIDTLFCFADHNIDLGMSGTGSDYGCLSAFMCRPQPPPVACPPLESNLPTSYPTSSSFISSIATTWTTTVPTSISSETGITTVTTFVSTVWATITATQSVSSCLPMSTFTSSSSISAPPTFVSSTTAFNISQSLTSTASWSFTSLRPTFSVTANSTTSGGTGTVTGIWPTGSGTGTSIWPTGTGSGTGTGVWPTGTVTGTGTGAWPTGSGTGTGTGAWPTGTGTGTGTGGPGSPEPTERQLTVSIQAHPRQVRIERPWSAIIQQAYFDIWGNCHGGSVEIAGNTNITYQCSGSNITGYSRRTIVPMLIDALYRAGQQNTWISQDNAYTTLPISVSITVSDGINRAYVQYVLAAGQDNFDFMGGQCVTCDGNLFTVSWDQAVEDAFAPVPDTISMIEIENSCQPTEHCIKPGVVRARAGRFWWR